MAVNLCRCKVILIDVAKRVRVNVGLSVIKPSKCCVSSCSYSVGSPISSIIFSIVADSVEIARNCSCQWLKRTFYNHVYQEIVVIVRCSTMIRKVVRGKYAATCFIFKSITIKASTVSPLRNTSVVYLDFHGGVEPLNRWIFSIAPSSSLAVAHHIWCTILALTLWAWDS